MRIKRNRWDIDASSADVAHHNTSCSEHHDGNDRSCDVERPETLHMLQGLLERHQGQRYSIWTDLPKLAAAHDISQRRSGKWLA